MEEHEYFELLISRALDETLSNQERQALKRHLSGCSRCRALARELEQLHKSMDVWRDRNVPEGFARGIMDKIRSETPPAPISEPEPEPATKIYHISGRTRPAAGEERRSDAPARTSGGRRSFAWLRPLAAVAACAVVLVGVASSGLFRMGMGGGSSGSFNSTASAGGSADSTGGSSSALFSAAQDAGAAASAEEFGTGGAYPEPDIAFSTTASEAPAAAPAEPREDQTDRAQEEDVRHKGWLDLPADRERVYGGQEVIDELEQTLGTRPRRILELATAPEGYDREDWGETEDFYYLALDTAPPEEVRNAALADLTVAEDAGGAPEERGPVVLVLIK